MKIVSVVVMAIVIIVVVVVVVVIVIVVMFVSTYSCDRSSSALDLPSLLEKAKQFMLLCSDRVSLGFLFRILALTGDNDELLRELKACTAT